MKRLFVLVAIAAFFLPATAQEKTLQELTVKNVTYRNVTVTKVEPDGVKILHDEGFAKIKIEDLTEAHRSLFGLVFDPHDVAAFRAAESERKSMERAAAANLAKREELEKRAAKAVVHIEGEVSLVGKGYVILTGPRQYFPAERAYASVRGDFVLIRLDVTRVVSGQQIQVECYPIGQAPYETLQMDAYTQYRADYFDYHNGVLSKLD